MRICAACQHENADHLGFCVQCGHRLAGTERLAFAPAVPLTAPVGMSAGAAAPARGPMVPAAIAWMRSSVVYVFTHLRGRIDTVRRRRALESERNGEQRLLRRAVADLGAAVRAEAVETPALALAMEAVRGAERRRDLAVASLAEAERLQVDEDLRLAAEEQAAAGALRACEEALSVAEEAHRSAVVEREALNAIARGSTGPHTTEDVGDLPTIGLPQGTGSRAMEIEARMTRLRAEVERLRTEARDARAHLDQVISGRRHAARDLSLSLTGRRRDRADAEVQLAAVLEQLGDAALIERPSRPALDPLYQRVDKLAEMVTLREQQLRELERDLERPEPKRLAAGILLLLVPLLSLLTLWLALN